MISNYQCQLGPSSNSHFCHAPPSVALAEMAVALSNVIFHWPREAELRQNLK